MRRRVFWGFIFLVVLVGAMSAKLLMSASKASPTPWTRAAGNPILSPSSAWEQTAVQEPTLSYDAGTDTYVMYYTGGWLNPGLGRATCPGTSDPTVAANWTRYAGNPILGQGGSGVAGFVSGTNVTKVGSTYYAYYYDALGGGNLKVSTSSDGLAWNTPTTAIASTAVAWVSGWANSFAWNEGGNTWKMLVEGRSTGVGNPWTISYATSTDGLSWTVQGSGPLTSLSIGGIGDYSGPWLTNGGVKTNGRYQLWFHAAITDINFTDIYHAYSTDAQNWTITGNELYANHGTYEAQQVADPSVIEKGNFTYMAYDGVNNNTSTSYINIAKYPGSIANLVLWK